jgi:hypothetical protein
MEFSEAGSVCDVMPPMVIFGILPVVTRGLGRLFVRSHHQCEAKPAGFRLNPRVSQSRPSNSLARRNSAFHLLILHVHRIRKNKRKTKQA